MIFVKSMILRTFGAAALASSLVACTTAPRASNTSLTATEIRVMSSSLGAAPAAGAVTRTTVYESPHTVTQVLRIARGAQIAPHHHPSYDETFLVQQGRLRLMLNGRNYDVGAGEFVVMPAGTDISGANAGDEEARVVVAFSNNGTTGPLSVPGVAQH